MDELELDAPTDDGAIAGVDPGELAVERLGEPDDVYAVSGGRFAAKFTIGMGLVVYGVGANLIALQFGVWRFDHVTLLLVFAPMFAGVSLLRHLYATRGLRVLVYPTGVLRVQRGRATAFPWEEIAAIGLRAEVARPMTLSIGGRVSDGWFALASPAVRIGNSGMTLLRQDGASATLSPALARYDELTELIQRATFRHLWPDVWAHVKSGGAVGLGPVTADGEGIWLGNRGVAWADGPEVQVQGKVLEAAAGRKRVQVELENVPNPHLLVGLVEAVRLEGLPGVGATSAGGPGGAEPSPDARDDS